MNPDFESRECPDDATLGSAGAFKTGACPRDCRG